MDRFLFDYYITNNESIKRMWAYSCADVVYASTIGVLRGTVLSKREGEGGGEVREGEGQRERGFKLYWSWLV